VKKPVDQIDFVDVGAGTGIWTRLVHGRGVRSTAAVEPNDDMRNAGMQDSQGTAISWRKGSGEDTGLAPQSADLLSMASSFHWVDFDKGVDEFSRVLRPNGWFLALWNPRYIEANPLLVRIEQRLQDLKPDLVRVSSGRSGITATLTERLWACGNFQDVVYLEGRHVRQMTPEEYIGAWRSVNDIQSQLGAQKFASFLDYVREQTASHDRIETVYLTRAWAAQTRAAA
jgi:ubiquinone/menaquinone biosynthesis C-methylase UbiE